MKRKAIVLTAVSAIGMVWLFATAQQKSDQVIKNDGTSITGHVNSVDQTTVVVDGHNIARAEVRAIVFAGGAFSTRQRQSGSTDLVVKRAGGSSYGHVRKVTGLVVVQNDLEIPRSTVAIIAFNVPSNVIDVIPSPSPSPRPSPSPSPSPGSTQGAQDANPANDVNTDLDLSGLWVTSEGEEVQLTQLKNGSGAATVFAIFTKNNKLPNGACQFGDRREKFIDGSLEGKKLTGTMWRCTDSEALFKDCHVAPVFKTTFQAEVISKDQISGKRRTEYWGPADNGQCKFTRDPSGDRDVAFRITRKPPKP